MAGARAADAKTSQAADRTELGSRRCLIFDAAQRLSSIERESVDGLSRGARGLATFMAKRRAAAAGIAIESFSLLSRGQAGPPSGPLRT